MVTKRNKLMDVTSCPPLVMRRPSWSRVSSSLSSLSEEYCFLTGGGLGFGAAAAGFSAGFGASTFDVLLEPS